MREGRRLGHRSIFSLAVAMFFFKFLLPPLEFFFLALIGPLLRSPSTPPPSASALSILEAILWRCDDPEFVAFRVRHVVRQELGHVFADASPPQE